MPNRQEERDALLGPLRQALQASDEEGAVRALVRAMNAGATPHRIEETILRVMAQGGQELHSMLQVSAAFDIAGGIGPEAGRYTLAAAAVQIARQPKDSRVSDLLEEARGALALDTSHPSLGEVERRLADALDRGEVAAAIASALALRRLAHDSVYVLDAFAKWGARPEVIVKPQGYVTHLPLQAAAALDLLKRLEHASDQELLLAHLAYCQIELAKKYTTRRVAPEAVVAPDPSQALLDLRPAIHRGELGRLLPLIESAAARPQFVDEVGRVLMRCGVEAQGPLSHRFTLSDAARRLAKRAHPVVARRILACAALSIAHGYTGPKRLLDVKDLPHPRPGGSDYSGRLLVGITSNHLPEAHAALRGLFEAGTSPRQIALAFLDAASHIDAHVLRSDHAFVLTQCAWRALADGFFAGEAAPLLAELAAVLTAAPKDHALIQWVEESQEAAGGTPHAG